MAAAVALPQQRRPEGMQEQLVRSLGRVSMNRALSTDEDLFFDRDLRNTVRLRIFYAKTLVASKLANCKEIALSFCNRTRVVIIRKIIEFFTVQHLPTSAGLDKN